MNSFASEMAVGPYSRENADPVRSPAADRSRPAASAWVRLSDRGAPRRLIERIANPAAPERAAILVLILSTALRLAICGLVDPSVDEAYYWDWSRHLAWGYFDHPPMVAWLIRLGTELFGDNAFGIRFVPVIWGTGFLWFTYLFARTLFGPLTAYRTVAVASVAPVYVIGVGMLALPETALALPWAASLWAMALILFDRPTPRRWLLLGLLFGLGLQAKATGVLLMAILGLFLVVAKERRRLVLSGWFWLSLAIGAVVFLPFVIWNYLNHWPSFSAMGARISENTRLHFGRALGVQLAQLVFLTPFLWLLVWRSAIDSVRGFIRDGNEKLLFLALFFLVPQVGFGILAVEKKVLPHWAALGFITGIAAFAALAPEWLKRPAEALGERRGNAGRTLLLTVATPLVVSLLIPLGTLVPAVPASISAMTRLRLVSPGAESIDPMGDVEGSEQAAMETQRLLDSISPQNGSIPVLTYHWGVAGRLAFGMRPNGHVLAVGKEANQYGLWKSPSELLGGDALLVKDALFHADFAQTFDCEELKALPPFEAKWNGYTVRTWSFAYCKNLRRILPFDTDKDMADLGQSRPLSSR